MKNVFIIILIFICFESSADDSWLSVEWAFQIGWIPQGDIQFYKPEASYHYAQSFNAIFKIDTNFIKFIKLGGFIVSLFGYSETGKNFINFIPSGMTYTFYCGIEPITGISVIYEHSCSHPVITWYQNQKGNIILDTFYDRIYIEIKGHLFY